VHENEYHLYFFDFVTNHELIGRVCVFQLIWIVLTVARTFCRILGWV